ncbi:hypothetical protein [Haloarcula nitratireducens]|uniref:DUF8081 domain-containing protein n=1 Tax=Haloarcula nitratireducens TaxID=2487749 RepID=A0AAW4P6E1_9EURY|nr:hypothetical protein [Halomicroarcula nitratireducens]MBX0293313.1 hypothetical protein [Halomicroarcula nitratireducens]
MAEDCYRVVVKPSARRVSARVGRWVNRAGPRRTFDSKALAREWARTCGGPTAPVWIQDAPPWAEDDADGYLVGRSHDVSRPDPPGRQRTLGE